VSRSVFEKNEQKVFPKIAQYKVSLRELFTYYELLRNFIEELTKKCYKNFVRVLISLGLFFPKWRNVAESGHTELE
jgi:hypothetical protein